jgi:hypothetical protein
LRNNKNESQAFISNIFSTAKHWFHLDCQCSFHLLTKQRKDSNHCALRAGGGSKTGSRRIAKVPAVEEIFSVRVDPSFAGGNNGTGRDREWPLCHSRGTEIYFVKNIGYSGCG